MLAKDLINIKQSLKKSLPKGGIGSVIAQLKKELPEHSAKYNSVLSIEGRLNDSNLKKIRGILSNEQLQLEYNILRNDLLMLIDSLQESDFLPKETTAQKAKTGHILYSIPPKMELGTEAKCIVRLAFEETTIHPEY